LGSIAKSGNAIFGSSCLLRPSNLNKTFIRAPTRFDDLIGVWEYPCAGGRKKMGRAAPSTFPVIPMALPIPPIALDSRILEEELEESHYQYTDRLVTHRSPKLCMDRYQWHGRIHLNTHPNRVCRPRLFRSFPSLSKALQKEPVAGFATEDAFGNAKSGTLERPLYRNPKALCSSSRRCLPPRREIQAMRLDCPHGRALLFL
jgi:hypothetical protein